MKTAPFDRAWLEKQLSHGVDDGAYRDWLAFFFDRPEGEWYWEDEFYDERPDFEPEKISRLIGLTFLRSGNDLARLSNAQLGYGFNYMLMVGGESCKVHDPAVPREVKDALLGATFILYADCFEKRCAPIMDVDHSMLNYIAFILEEFPIGHWGGERDAEHFEALQLEVCERILLLDNPACAFGAMHTLNHMYSSPHQDRIERAINGYVTRHPEISQGLRDYARGAIAHRQIIAR